MRELFHESSRDKGSEQLASPRVLCGSEAAGWGRHGVKTRELVQTRELVPVVRLPHSRSLASNCKEARREHDVQMHKILERPASCRLEGSEDLPVALPTCAAPGLAARRPNYARQVSGVDREQERERERQMLEEQWLSWQDELVAQRQQQHSRASPPGHPPAAAERAKARKQSSGARTSLQFPRTSALEAEGAALDESVGADACAGSSELLSQQPASSGDAEAEHRRQELAELERVLLLEKLAMARREQAVLRVACVTLWHVVSNVSHCGMCQAICHTWACVKQCVTLWHDACVKCCTCHMCMCYTKGMLHVSHHVMCRVSSCSLRVFCCYLMSARPRPASSPRVLAPRPRSASSLRVLARVSRGLRDTDCPLLLICVSLHSMHQRQREWEEEEEEAKQKSKSRRQRPASARPPLPFGRARGGTGPADGRGDAGKPQVSQGLAPSHEYDGAKPDATAGAPVPGLAEEKGVARGTGYHKGKAYFYSSPLLVSYKTPKSPRVWVRRGGVTGCRLSAMLCTPLSLSCFAFGVRPLA